MKMRYFELARKVSYKSDHYRHRIGAVIVKKHRVLGVGFNRRKTHTKSPNSYKQLHAEVDATIGIPVDDMRGSSIYVYRERRDGTLGLARPCASCWAYLRGLGVTETHYTTYSGYTSEVIK